MVNDIEKVLYLTLQFSKNIEQSNKTLIRVINERIAFLTLTLLFNVIKLSITKEIRNTMIDNLKENELYPIKTKIKNKRKNLFKIVANNEFVFLQLCNFNQLFKS